MQMKEMGRRSEKERGLPGVKGRVCCRLRWFAVAETVAGAAVFLLLPCAEVSIPASSPSLFLSVFLLSVLASLSLFFSSLFSLYSFVFLSFCSSSAAPFSSALSSPVHEERGLLPLSSHGTGVGWSGRPLCSRPRTVRGARPLCFSPRGRPRVSA